jgi:hypothetical protein
MTKKSLGIISNTIVVELYLYCNIIMNTDYPIDIVTFKYKNGNPPTYLKKSISRTKSKHFHILRLSYDQYNEIKPYHAGFKHMKEITIPKIEKIINNTDIKGFFIAEGDLYLNDDFDFNAFLNLKLKRPTWIGYKKKLSNYIVGNFLIYIPVQYFDQLKEHFNNQKTLVYSDRFFSKLYFSGFLDLLPKSEASEIQHYSNVLGKIRL